MTTIVLVRHGQTEWNRVERFRGRIDVELNEMGRRQAEAVADRLCRRRTDAIYASPLKRALQTAEPIAKACGLEVQPVDELIDIDYGAWAGHSPDEVARSYGDLYRTWLDTPHRVEFPAGETLDLVRSRAWEALKRVCLHHDGQRVVLVSHVAVNRVLICSVLGLGSSCFWKIAQDNAAINVFRAEEGNFHLVLLNDTCHLKPLIDTGL